MTTQLNVTRKQRYFIDEAFVVSDWASIEPYFEDLKSRNLSTKEDLLVWLRDRSELSRIVSEDQRWRFIHTAIDTENETYDQSFKDFLKNIYPKISIADNLLDKKLNNSPLKDQLDKKRFGIYFRKVENNLLLFKEENIALSTEIELLSKKYIVLNGKMSIDCDGHEITLKQAAAYLEKQDRTLREQVFNKTVQRRLTETETLDNLFDELLSKRHQFALNAGFENYRDYKMKSLERFDYNVADCEQFHDSIELELVPIINQIYERRKNKLGVDKLQPYDLGVPLKEIDNPFESSQDLLDKSIKCLTKIDPFFADCLSEMNDRKLLDLESRKAKATGGFNCSLPDTGIPFVLMNFANSHSDVRTLLHEGGHAVHSILMHDLEYYPDSLIGSESAELASMSMELFALKAYDTFYPNEEEKDYIVADQIENIIIRLTWIALVDKFQHWIYTHPNHSRAERKDVWLNLHKRFSGNVVDWDGYSDYRDHLWHKQLHIFRIPFYYIEYGIAQLGAIGMWRNYLADEKEALDNYKTALGIGNTVTLPEMYHTAGVPFNFSRTYIKELKEFLVEQTS